MIEVGILPREQTPAFWHILEARMAEYPKLWDKQTIAGCYQFVLEGKMQIWVCLNAGSVDLVFFTEVIETLRGRILRVSHAVGANFDQYVPALMEQMGKVMLNMDLVAIEVVGRPGWVRKLKPYGFQVRDVTVEFSRRNLKELI
jgi:hypothetical protein